MSKASGSQFKFLMRRLSLGNTALKIVPIPKGSNSTSPPLGINILAVTVVSEVFENSFLKCMYMYLLRI